MSETVTVEELEGQIALRRQRFDQVIEDIRELLRVDIEAWIKRKTKQAYLAAPSVAEGLSTEDVGSLKRRSTELARSEAERVHRELADAGLWLDGASEPDNRRDITAAAGAWEEVRGVERALTALLDEFGLGGHDDVAYKPPAYFVNGRYMPSLAEHFWRLVHEMEQLRQQAADIEHEAIRADLEEKWESA